MPIDKPTQAPITKGLNHLGLSVLDLDKSKAFFVDALGWEEFGYDATYPRTFVSDGNIMLTLWQVDKSLEVEVFDRRKNVGLHHVALQVGSEAELDSAYQVVAAYPGVAIEFSPELLGDGPRKHMMIREPSGLRIEFIWPGNSFS